MTSLPYPIVEAGWLKAHLGKAGLKLVDASWRMPGQGEAYADYLERHIPGAVFFPIDDIADKSTDLPHMLPRAEEFSRSAGALGISERDRIVVYDDRGIFSSARGWWTFKAMGHVEVSVLNGGLPAWTQSGGPLTQTAAPIAGATYRAAPDMGRVATHEDVRTILQTGAAVVLDARPEGRFIGRDPEPRPGLRKGAMPGARNAPFADFIAEDGRLKSKDQLAQIFASRDVGPSTAVTTTCGSGVTAAIVALALEALGWPPARLYDGAWAEWGKESNDPRRFPATVGV